MNKHNNKRQLDRKKMPSSCFYFISTDMDFKFTVAVSRFNWNNLARGTLYLAAAIEVDYICMYKGIVNVEFYKMRLNVVEEIK